MNRNPRTVVLAVVAALATVWLLAYVANHVYFAPRRLLDQRIHAAATRVGEYRKDTDDRHRLDAELQQFVDRTLGGDLETVDHKLRSRLNRLAEHVQLQGAAVGTAGTGKLLASPARNEFRRSRELRVEIDFVELEGWISGAGTFEQVLRLVAAIEAEPWIKRIHQLKLDPKDNGARFDVKLNLTTLFLPKCAPNPANVLVANAAGFDRYQVLLERQPFRLPPPPPPPPDPQPQPITDPAPVVASFPYDQWSLTGVAQSPAGAEIWLLQGQTRESRRLAVGEGLGDIIFAATDGETAEFRLGEQRFRVAVGKNLNDRTQVDQ